ncbi:MAG TPA: metallophosphoesterase [Savagea sp.]
MTVLLFSIGGMIALLSIIGYMRWTAARERLLIHHFTIPSASDGQFSFVFISDIHRRTLSRQWIERVRKAGNVDFVIIGGDLAERDVPLERIRHNVTELSQFGPVYYVWGNNDREIGEETMRTLLQERRVTILDNDVYPLRHHEQWCIGGTDDPSSGRTDVQRVVQRSERYRHFLYVSHSPILFPKIKTWRRPDVQLAGHTHGGQIRLGPIGLYAHGSVTRTDGTYTVISNGYGTTAVPLRFGALPEAHYVTITYGREEGGNEQ